MKQIDHHNPMGEKKCKEEMMMPVFLCSCKEINDAYCDIVHP
jgi:hypothetical protein